MSVLRFPRIVSEKRHNSMKKHNVLKGAVATVAAIATLGAMAAPAFAQDGKGIAELKEHGGAQRIAAIGSENAKNVILFIGDGMGDSEITVARNYLHGVNGTFEGLDKIGQPSALLGGDGSQAEAGTDQYTTFSLGGSSDDSLMAKKSDGSLAGNKTSGKITPVTDSSASGSSWATGTKTYNNAVDVDIDGNPQLNLIELAKAKGLATGNVTTSEIQDATPAVQESHSTERACYGPQGKWDGKTDTNGDNKIDAKDGDAAKRCLANQLKANGGIGSISEQLMDTAADVTIGGGAKYFNQIDTTYEGGTKTLWQQAADRGFQTVKSGDVDGFKNLTYQQGKPVLALLGDGNLPTQYNPSVATKANPAKDEHPTTCEVNKGWLGNQGASLADFTNKALDLLKANPKSSNGFFLQVEGASIDKQDHNANACGQIGETDDLDKAISAALKKVDLSNTLIIVTADHAHTSQIVESQPYYALSTVLQNALGEKMVVSYGTSEAPVYQDENGNAIDNDEYTQGTNGDANTGVKFEKAQSNMSHTGTQLRIAASGPGAQRVVGLSDQTDNFYTLGQALGLAVDKDDQNALSKNGAVKVNNKDGQYSAEITGFNGDAVLSYKLSDKSGNVIAESDSSTPVSGVRVKTAAITDIALDKVAEGGEYTLTVTGRQSGKTVAVDFQGPAKQSGNLTPGANGSSNGTVAQGNVKEPKNTEALGKTGATVLGFVLLALALLAGGVALKLAKDRR